MNGVVCKKQLEAGNRQLQWLFRSSGLTMGDGKALAGLWGLAPGSARDSSEAGSVEQPV